MIICYVKSNDPLYSLGLTASKTDRPAKSDKRDRQRANVNEVKRTIATHPFQPISPDMFFKSYQAARK